MLLRPTRYLEIVSTDTRPTPVNPRPGKVAL